MADLREKLKETLEKSVEYVCEKCSGRYCRDCEYDKYGDDCEANAMVDSLIANGVTIQRWIPVTERLPEPFEVVLVYDNIDKYVSDAYMTIHQEWVGIRAKRDVTHWMPLPEAPGDQHGLRPRNDWEVE